jgi:benzodiazapine receptor
MQNSIISNRTSLVGLGVFLLICFGVAALGSLATTPEIRGWYAALRKPSFTPPDWLFGPVWTALYAAMAVAAWMVWKRTGWQSGAMAVFAIQLALNLAWSFIFFKFHETGLALVEIALLWAAIAATIIKFAPISNGAALLLAPYLAWVTYAAALNFSIWRLNS